jgi:peptidyl-prolyl cis-trans isomerase B (cyclophilin B)
MFGKDKKSKQDPAALAGITATVDTTAGTMELSFLPEKAPGHVANFVKLAEQGFYNGTVFHRTIPGFMIQGGCPKGTGTGGPGYNIDAEFNDTPHVRGVLSMARSQDPNSAGSQFFICHGTASFLDKQYTAFGKLTAGADVLDKIANAPTKKGGEGSSPVAPIKINKVTIKRPAAGTGTAR